MTEPNATTAKLSPVFAFILLLGLVVSTIGDEIFLIVMTLELKSLTESGYIIAAFLASQFLPGVLLTPIAGQLIDRFETTKVLIITQALQALTLCALAFVANTTLLIIGSFVLGSLFSISQPALYTLIPNISSRMNIDTKRVNAIVEFFTRFALLIGPVIGALLLTTVGRTGALLIDALTFVVAALILRFIGVRREPEQKGEQKRLFDGAAEGFRYLRRDKVLRVTIPAFMIGVASTALVGVTFVFLVTDLMQQSPIIYAFLTAMWGIGMLMGTVIIARRKSQDQLERPTMLGMLGMGFSLLTTGLFPKVWIVAIAEIFGGVTNGIVNVSLISLLQGRAPDEIRGRVMAAYGAFLRLAIITGYAIASPFASAYPAVIYIVSGSATIVIGLIGFITVLFIKDIALPQQEPVIDS